MSQETSKKTEKEDSKKEKSKKENKKSKYGLSKETLERILEMKIHKERLPKKEEFVDEEISEEFFNNFLLQNPNSKKTSASLEAINPNQEGNLGNIIHSGWQNQSGANTDGQGNRNGNGFEYIPKNSEESEGKKYQSYEVNTNIKTTKPEDVSSDWSKSFTKSKDFKFVKYEQDSSQEPKYEKVFTPRKMNDDEMKKLHDRKVLDFNFEGQKMHYYESE